MDITVMSVITTSLLMSIIILAFCVFFRKRTILRRIGPERGCEVGNYAYYQGKLYFIGNDFSLYSYDIAKDKLEAFEGMKARRFLITPEGIFYANANDAWKLYFMDFNGEGKRKLADMAITSMDFDGERLYYVSVMESGRPIYSMAPDGSDVQIVFELPEAYALSYIEEEQTLYVSYRDSEGKRALYSYELSEETR